MDGEESDVHIATAEQVFQDLVDEAALGVAFETHRAVKLGYLFLDESEEPDRSYEIVDDPGLDIFGQVPSKKQYECVCPNCGRNMAASRFAPHLEKCMGMGRNSSRIASRRIANTRRLDDEALLDDYDNDSDWNWERKVSKRKRDKNSPRRGKKVSKNQSSSQTSTASNSAVATTNVVLVTTNQQQGTSIASASSALDENIEVEIEDTPPSDSSSSWSPPRDSNGVHSNGSA